MPTVIDSLKTLATMAIFSLCILLFALKLADVASLGPDDDIHLASSDPQSFPSAAGSAPSPIRADRLRLGVIQ